MARPGRALVFVWLATIAVFAPALRGDYVDDDLDLLGVSPAFAGLGHLADAIRTPFWGYELGYWRPLTSALMCIGHVLGNGHPWPTHLAALLAHLAATTLVFAIVRRVGAPEFAALAAALFALHPCQVEAVAWVAALGDPLSGAATLLAILGWLRWRERNGAGLPLLAWIGVILAIAAKESGVVAIGWLAAIDVATRTHAPLPRQRRVVAWRGILVVLAAYYVLRVLVFGDAAAGFGRGALDTGFHGTERVTLGAFLGTSFVVLPTGWLDFTPYRWMPASAATAWDVLPWRAVMFVLAVGAMTTAMRLHRELAITCGLGLAATIAPAVLLPTTLGPWPLVDRYLYVGMFAFAGILLGCGGLRPRLGLAFVVVCAIVSALQVPKWRTQDAVVARALVDAPRHPESHFMAGNAARAAAEHEPQDAAHRAAIEAHCRRALEHYRHARALLASPLYAAAHLERVLGPGVETGSALAELHEGRRSPADIGRTLDVATRRFPAAPELQLTRGMVAAIAGDVATAEAAWLRTLELEPTNDQAACNLGRLYAESRRFDAARERLQQALSLNPGNTVARALLDRLPR